MSIFELWPEIDTFTELHDALKTLLEQILQNCLEKDSQ